MLDSVVPTLVSPLLDVGRDDLDGVLKRLAEIPGNMHRALPSARVPEALRNADSKRVPEVLFGTEGIKQLIREVTDLGLVIIGQGDDAIVFANDSDAWVLRIGQYPEPQDRYAAVSMTSSNPHLPLFWYHRSVSLVAVSIMERLEVLDGSEHELWSSINLAASTAHAINDGRMPHDEDVRELERSLLDAARILGKTARDNDYALDLTKSNIMRRPSDGHPVFIDPWCPWGD